MGPGLEIFVWGGKDLLPKPSHPTFADARSVPALQEELPSEATKSLAQMGTRIISARKASVVALIVLIANRLGSAQGLHLGLFIHADGHGIAGPLWYGAAIRRSSSSLLGRRPSGAATCIAGHFSRQIWNYYNG